MACRKPIILLIFLALALAVAMPANAESYSWQVNYQHVILNIEPSGQVDMTYTVSAVIQEGVWNEVWIPQTDSSQNVVGIVDGNGQNHTSYTEDGQIKVQGFNLNPGDPVTLTIYSTINPFVYTSDKAGYDIVTFTPPWWDMTITGTQDNPSTQVKFYLPGNVPKDQVFTGSKLYDNFGVEGNDTWVYFQSTSLSPNEQFQVAVSFPDSYMNPGAVTSSSGSAGGSSSGVIDTGSGSALGALGGLFSCLCANPVFFIIIIIIIGFVFGQFGRSSYKSPVVSMDGIGINKEMDPVEAATLLRIDPKRVLTMVMFGMMKKGNVKLISTDPVRLELVSRQDLNYYEKLFADAIKNNALDEDGMLNCFKVLARRVVDKTRPYSRKDTELYYKQKIDEAWAQIQAVDTPELKLQKYDTNMIWLMADEQFKQKTTDYVAKAPGSDRVYVPPTYWWYPYYFGMPHYYGGTTGAPQHTGAPVQTGTPAQTGAPSTAGRPTNTTTASVETFANSISNSVEATSAGVVGSVEKFVGIQKAANAPPAATSAPTFRNTGGGGSCACVSCACACVSCACACACAGGGHGCT